jgi:hypothetical protein
MPHTEEHKRRIAKALEKHTRTPEHCASIAIAARERYKNPENHPMWKGGVRWTFQRHAREIMGVTNPELDVHHIDGNWKNNAKGNLRVMKHTEHTALHKRRRAS